jgi:hypothetical protein
MNYVRLRCVKATNRLRVFIVSHGYLQDCHCQIPKHLLKENAEFLVSQIRFLSDNRDLFRYRINPADITVADALVTDDVFDSSCVVCKKGTCGQVFAPCGHFCMCTKCAYKALCGGKCAICSEKIQTSVPSYKLKSY